MTTTTDLLRNACTRLASLAMDAERLRCRTLPLVDLAGPDQLSWMLQQLSAVDWEITQVRAAVEAAMDRAS